MLTEAQLVSEGRAASASQTWFRFRSQDALLQGLGSPFATKKKSCFTLLRGVEGLAPHFWWRGPALLLLMAASNHPFIYSHKHTFQI